MFPPICTILEAGTGHEKIKRTCNDDDLRCDLVAIDLRDHLSLREGDAMKTLPEKLEVELKAEGTSKLTGGRRQVWENKALGITVVVTWAEPYPDVGIQQLSIKDLPLHTFTNYEALRTAYAKHWSKDQ